jgi:hypothetical protein
MNEIEEKLSDLFLEHELERMERRKTEIEDINYAKCVGIPNMKVRPCK